MFIAGAYQNSNRDNQPVDLFLLVSSMAQTLSHRSSKYFCINEANVSLASNNKPDDNQSEYEQDYKDILLVYSGRLFNQRELKSVLLLPEGASVETVLKAAYWKWGDVFIERLKGEIAIAIYDKPRSRLLLARDRVGMKPMFYCYEEGMFRFASEVKALVRQKKNIEINCASVHSCLVFGWVYSAEHLIKGVYELRAGHVLILEKDSDNPVIHQYWDRVFNISRSLFSYYEETFRVLLKESVKKRLPASEEKVGVALSGGVDSTLITALISQYHQGPIHTYTMIAKGDKHSEYRHARLVAKRFDTEHHEIVVSAEEALQSLPRILWYMDEFTGSNSSASICMQVYFTGKSANEHECRYIFTGNGVEHNFDGNLGQRRIYKFFHNSNKVPGLLKDKFLSRLPDKLKRRISYSWSTGELAGLEEHYIKSVCGEHNLNLPSRYSSDFKKKSDLYYFRNMLSEYINTHIADEYFNKLIYLNFKTARYSVINERLFGAFGICTQIPFNDTEVIQLSSSMPIKFKHNFRKTKYFIKRIFKETLPSAILQKEKCRSYPRFAFSGQKSLNIMSFFVNQLRKREIFEDSYIDEILSSEGNLEVAGDLLRLFSLELWLRIFLDNPGISEDNLTLDFLSRS